MSLLEMRDIWFRVGGGRGFPVLRGVSLSVGGGRVVGLIGPSGSGKTTLLRIAYMELRPSGGELFVFGERVGWSLRQVSRLRRYIGFVPQENVLLEELSVVENVALPLIIRGVGYGDAVERASLLLERLGLGDRLDASPGVLSFGERRRVLVAQAVVYSPRLLLADEPTNGLDEDLAAVVMDVIGGLAASGSGVLVASHDPVVRERVDEVVVIRGGLVVSRASRRR